MQFLPVEPPRMSSGIIHPGFCCCCCSCLLNKDVNPTTVDEDQDGLEAAVTASQRATATNAVQYDNSLMLCLFIISTTTG